MSTLSGIAASDRTITTPMREGYRRRPSRESGQGLIGITAGGRPGGVGVGHDRVAEIAPQPQRASSSDSLGSNPSKMLVSFNRVPFR